MLKPLEDILRIILQFYLSFANPLLSLSLLSLTVFLVMIPLYKIADYLTLKDKEKKKVMQADLDTLVNLKNNYEKHFYIKEIYKRNNYHPIQSLTSLLGLLIQIPFFIAAYVMLKHFEGFNGTSTFIFKDLSHPDGLFKMEGKLINIMPFIMTIINLISAIIYNIGEKKKDKFNLIIFPLLFLILLYKQPVALVFYWTINNILSLIKNIIIKRKLIRIKSFYKDENFNISFIIVTLLLQFTTFISSNHIRTKFSVLILSLANFYLCFLLFTKYKTFKNKKSLAINTYLSINIISLLVILSGIILKITKITLKPDFNAKMISIITIATLLFLFILNVFIYYLKSIKAIIKEPNEKLGKNLFLINYLLGVPLLLFLMLFLYSQKGSVSPDLTRHFIALFSIVFTFSHILLSLNYYKYLKNSFLLILSILTTVFGTIVIQNMHGGKIMFIFLAIELTGMFLLFLRFLKFTFDLSLKDSLKFLITPDEQTKTNFIIFILSLTTLFIISFINNPILIFNSDSGFFVYPFKELLPALLKFGAFVTIPFLILYLIKPLQKTLLYLLFTLTIFSYFFAYVYHPYIGVMQGMEFLDIKEMYRTTLINTLEFIVSIIAFLSLLVFLNKNKATALLISSVLFIIVSISSYSNFKKLDAPNDISKDISKAKLEDLLPKGYKDDLAFSKDKKNILVVLFDGFEGPFATKVFREYPEIKAKFDGFTYYRNTVTAAGYTFGSKLSILAGKTYTPENYNRLHANKNTTMDEAYKKAYMIVPDILKKESYKTYYHNPYLTSLLGENDYLSQAFDIEYFNYWRKFFRIKNIKVTKRISKGYLLYLSTFKSLAYYFKPFFYKFFGLDHLFSKEGKGNFNVISHRLPILDLFPYLANNKGQNKTYKFFHLMSTHVPFCINKDLILTKNCDLNDESEIRANPYYTIAYSLRAFGYWIDWMRANGVYDNTKIILTSDHGWYGQNSNQKWWNIIKTEEDKGFLINYGGIASLMMVKDFDSKGEIKYSNKPMISSDVPYLITKKMPDSENIYKSLNTYRTNFIYQYAPYTENYLGKTFFDELDKVRAKIKYNKEENLFYYKMTGMDKFKVLFKYGDGLGRNYD